jgi:hypothetical protein
MTTKAPSAVEPAAADTLESIAYASVAGVGTVEPNDRQRLGYHVWRWLTSKEGTLEQAVSESAARMTMSVGAASAMIAAALKERGINVP